MAEYKKICKFEATRNPSRWIITTLMDLESLNAAVKLMFDSTSELWPAVRKTGLWKNKFYFDFKFGVCEQVLAERVNRYNAQVHEETGLEFSRLDAAMKQIDADKMYLLKTKCYSQILCNEDKARLLVWLTNGLAKAPTARTPLLRDAHSLVQAIHEALRIEHDNNDIVGIVKRVAANAFTESGGSARAPMYQNLVSLHLITDKSSACTETDKLQNVYYIKTPIWSIDDEAKTEAKIVSISDESSKQTRNRISQFLIFDKGDKNPHHFPCCMGYGFELHFAKPVLFENNGKAREDTISLISKACNLCRPAWLQSKYNDLTFYEIWPEKDLLSIEILPGCDVKWPSESIAKETRDMCLQKVIELFNGKSAYPTEIKIAKKVVPTVSIKPAIESEPKIVLKPSEVSIKSEAVLIQVSQNVKAKSLLSRIMH